MCLQMAALDQTLGKLFAVLDKDRRRLCRRADRRPWRARPPERNRQNGIPEDHRVAEDFTFETLNKQVTDALGLPGPVLLGAELGDVWFAPTLTAEQRAKASAKAIELLKAQPDVAAVFTGPEIEATPAPKGPPETWT
jgi:hypothetical protein